MLPKVVNVTLRLAQTEPAVTALVKGPVTLVQGTLRVTPLPQLAHQRACAQGAALQDVCIRMSAFSLPAAFSQALGGHFSASLRCGPESSFCIEGDTETYQTGRCPLPEVTLAGGCWASKWAYSPQPVSHQTPRCSTSDRHCRVSKNRDYFLSLAGVGYTHHSGLVTSKSRYQPTRGILRREGSAA